MGSLKVKKHTVGNAVSVINTNLLRPDQSIYLYHNILKAIDEAIKNNDTRIIISEAPTGSGKSFVMANVTIPALIHQDPTVESIVVTSPDSGCVDALYQKTKSLWDDKVITNCHGNRVRIRVLNGSELKTYLASDQVFESVEPIVTVSFAHTQRLGIIWGEYIDPNVTSYTAGVPDRILVDEIQYGMGTVNAQTIFEDQGRRNSNYDPRWLPILIKLSQLGCKVIGYTGTPTQSQQGNTSYGSTVFNPLSPMPKNKDHTAFTRGWHSPRVSDVYQNSKEHIREELLKLGSLTRRIENDTWSKAKEIGIVNMMPGALFKFGQLNATNGLALKSEYRPNGREHDFKRWASSLGADYGIVTCTHKEYQRTGSINPYLFGTVASAIEVINRANEPVNFSAAVCLAVIRQGNMGWDIPRLKYIVVLTHPSGKEVTIMQEQLMARGNRLPFMGMSSHVDTANKIASLSITTEQKRLVAEYVVFMCTVEVHYSAGSCLTDSAYRRFAKDTSSPEEGTKLYMDAIDNYVPKNNVTTFKAPRFTKGYSAGTFNQSHRKCYCEACMAAGSVDLHTGKTICEVEARKVREFERGSIFSDDEWDNVWFHTLVTDHKDGDRTNEIPDNLITRCPSNNGVKTYDAMDFLNRYDKDGKKVA